MNAVLTGGTGFVGGRLAAALAASGHEVKCLVRNTSRVEGLTKLGVKLCYGDLSDPDSFAELTKGGDIVYHIAAMVSDWGAKEDFYKANVEGTRNLLKSSLESGVRRFVHLSTCSILWDYDISKPRNLVDIDETCPYPERHKDPYNETKAEAEKEVIRFYKEHGLETVVLRPSGIWGAGDTVILPRLARAAKKGMLISIGKGDGLVSPCHVENLVNALILAGESVNAPGNIYFINDGMKIEHLNFISKLLDAAGIEWSPGMSIPYPLAYGLAFLIETGAKILKSKKPPVLTRFAVSALGGSRAYRIDKAKRELDYKPIISFDDGLRELREWVGSMGGVEELINKISS